VRTPTVAAVAGRYSRHCHGCQLGRRPTSLKALGFIAGISEQLAPANGNGATGEAISLVEQFGSAHGANGEVAAQLKQALARGETAFAVPGIPGARGFGSSTPGEVALQTAERFLA
jgi:hypothetical protein